MKLEDDAKVELRIEALKCDPRTMRFRTALASGEHQSHGKFEITMCVSGAAIYVMGKGFQYAVPIRAIAAAVFAHLAEPAPPAGEGET